MSLMTLYCFGPDGLIASEADFGNSWLGAMYIWRSLAVKYLRIRNEDLDATIARECFRNECRDIWKLAKDARLEMAERVVLATTFDGVLCEPDKLNVLADAFVRFAQLHPGPSHAIAQAEMLRKIDPGTCRGIGWWQTSVSADHWYIATPEEDETRPYDLNIDTDHWWLFEELAKNGYEAV